jgi:hypothetical protein
MRYTAYKAIAGTAHHQLMSRNTDQARLNLVRTFANQFQQGRQTLLIGDDEEFNNVRQISVVRNEAAALFLIEGKTGYRLHVLAQSGYITGLTNSADMEMLAQLRANLNAYGPGWEPESSGLTIDPPAYYSVLEAPQTVEIGTAEGILRCLFPLAEALAIGFFYSIRLDGPDAYEWQDPDQVEEW